MAAAGFLSILGAIRDRSDCARAKSGSETRQFFRAKIFGAAQTAPRRGLCGEREEASSIEATPKKPAVGMLEARRTGLRGETYAYGYLRRQGHVLSRATISRVERKAKSTRSVGREDAGVCRGADDPRRADVLPELSVTTDKQRCGRRKDFSARHVGECPCRFDVLAIDNRPGMPPDVRLHKDAFSPQLSNWVW